MIDPSTAPLILDFDGSVLPLADDEIRIPLHDEQETMRFGCTRKQFRDFETRLALPDSHGCAFLGSGDYHHLSLLLLKRLAATHEKLSVIVCDNHPDNMRYPFGIHCGSWVSHASRLPFVSHVYVIGITSDDITAKRGWENYLSPLISGKLSYWSIGKSADWLNLLGAKKAHRRFDSADALTAAFCKRVRNMEEAVYLSIDKDVFSPDIVKTNWDQGCFGLKHILDLIAACRGKLAGADVTGEVSAYAYRGWFKKMLAGREGLASPDPARIKEWQERHRDFNRKLLALFGRVLI